MKTLLSFLLLVAAFALGGCVTADNLTAADYGAKPKNAVARSRSYLEQVLKDPESARYKFGSLVKAVTMDGLIYGGATRAPG